MKFENVELKTLADITSGKIKLPIEFSQEGIDEDAVREAFNKQVNELTKDHRTLRKNQQEVFSIIEEGVDEELPKNVLNGFGDLVELKIKSNGDKPRFLVEKNKGGIKNSVTEIGLGGRVKRYKKESGYIEPQMKAYGTATSIELEELRSGMMNWADFKTEVADGIAQNILIAANKGLQTAIAKMPARQKDSSSSFDATKFDKLLAMAKSYAPNGKVKIVCTELFAQTIPFDTYFQVDSQDKRDFGYVRKYKGAEVQVVPNALKDNISTEWQLDNKNAYIMPVGKNGKIVKVVIEGQSEMREVDDQDTDEKVYQIYDRAGVVVVTLPNVFVYTNTAL